jgi:uncharacterized protein YeaO (DUF488 family)
LATAKDHWIRLRGQDPSSHSISCGGGLLLAPCFFVARYNFCVLKLKRIYEPPQRSDGYRILVDRVWPRGVSKERAAIALWLKEIGPSTALRNWFGHEPARWPEFQKRYGRELRDQPELTEQIKQLEKEHGLVTLLFSARDEEHNQAVVLRDYLAKRNAPKGQGSRAKKAHA